MLRSFRLQAAAVAAGAWLAIAGSPGPAGKALARDEDLFIRPEDQHTVVFGSLDAGRSVFVSGGSKQSLTGPLDRPGLLLMESGGFGLTRERIRTDAGSIAVDRFTHQSSVVAGWQASEGPVYLAVYAGPEVEQQQVAYDGRFRRLHGARLGARGQVELWANPTSWSLVTSTLVVGSVRESLWSRSSAGLAVAPGLFLGPEVTFYVTPTYTERRWGGHLTGLPLGPITMRVSAGWMTDDAHRRGSPYLGLSAWIRL